MNLADALIDFIIFVYQNTLLKFLNTDLPGISFATFSSNLETLHTYIITPLYIFDKFLPTTLLFLMVIAFIGLDLILWFIRLSITAWNMIRGSGARV